MSTGIALITGASRGIGKSIAQRLSKDGYHVVLADHPSQVEPLKAFQEEIKKTGAEATITVGDVSVEEDVIAMIKECVKVGGIDVMVANAGICITKPFLTTTSEDFNRIVSVNGLGTYLCYKYAALQMIEQGRGGRIIGASSLAGKQGWPLLSLYSSTKFLVRGLTQAVAREVAAHGITVNGYAPGPVDTSMMDVMGEKIKEILPSQADFDKAMAANVPPSGRFATVDEVAHLVSFLASKDAGQITGQTISINGGMYFE